MQPLVTLVIPFYNAGPYFEDCLRSVLGQTYPEIEYILIDDGSTDDSRKQLDALLDGPFRARKERVHILSQSNFGICKARHTGWKEASGDYIIQIDADDWVEPDMIERLVGTALSTGSDLVYCDYWKKYSKRVSRAREWEYRDIRMLLTDLIAGRHFHGMLWNKLIKSDLFTRGELCWPIVNVREDLVLTCQLAFRARKITHLPVPLYHYRKYIASSLLHQDKRSQTRKCAINQLHLYEFYRERETPNPVSVIRDAFLLETLWYIYRTQSWDLMDTHPFLWREGLHISLPKGLRRKWFRFLRLRAGLRRQGRMTGRL